MMATIKGNTGWLRCALLLVGVALMVAACNRGSLTTGVQYQAEGKYRSAYIEAKKVLQKDADNAQAWLLLGKATLMLGNPKDAEVDLQKARDLKVPAEQWAVPLGRTWLVNHEYDKILKTLPDGKGFKPQAQAELEVVRGDAYRASNQAAPARAAYTAALKLEPGNARALVGLSALDAAGGDMASARKYVQQAVENAPASQDAWVAKGNLAFSDGDFAGAEKAFQQALDLKTLGWLPQDRFMAQLRLADVQARQHDFDKALANIATLEKMAPQMPQPHYLHAVILFQQGHLDDAVTQLQQVLQVDSDDVAAQFLMGQLNYAKGNYGQAQMYLSNVMGMDPKNQQARALLALSFYREGSSSQALNTLRSVMPGQPSNADMLALMQRAVARGAGLPPSVSHPESAASIAGLPAAAASVGSPLDRQFAGVRAALAGGDAAKAIGLLKVMPEGKGAAATVRVALLVMAYARNKQAAEAAKVGAAWAAQHPQDASAHLLYGTALIAAGKRDKAHAEYEQAVKLDPNNVAALLNLGSLDSLNGKYKDAGARYRAILRIDPRSTAAMLALGKLAEGQRDQAGAISWYKRAIAAAPTSSEAYVRLIVVYTESGRFGDAVTTAQSLVTARPGDPLALNSLGAAELNAGHADKALPPLQQAVRQAPKVGLYRVNLARAQILTKDLKNARFNLEQVVKADPTEVQAVGMLAFMKFRAGDLPGAIALAHALQKPAATKLMGYTLEGDLYMAAQLSGKPGTGEDWRKAAAAYAQGLQISHTRELVLKHFQALDLGQDPKAEQGLVAWLGKHANDGALRMVLAQYYMNHGRQDESSREYRTLLKAYPSNVIALNNLAWMYVAQHNPNAVALAQKAHQLAPTSPSVADTYAWALLNADQAKAALPILEQAAKTAPDAGSIHYHLALAQSRTGDDAGARATLAALAKAGIKYPEQAAAAALYQKLGGAGAGN